MSTNPYNRLTPDERVELGGPPMMQSVRFHTYTPGDEVISFNAAALPVGAECQMHSRFSLEAGIVHNANRPGWLNHHRAPSSEQYCRGTILANLSREPHIPISRVRIDSVETR